MCRRPSLVLITSVAGDGHNVLVLDPLPRLPRHAAPPGLSPLGPLIHTRRPGCCGVPRARRSMQGCEKCLPYCICLQVMLYVEECMGGREGSFLMRESEHLWLSKPYTDFGQDGVNFSEQTPDRVLYAYMTA